MSPRPWEAERNVQIQRVNRWGPILVYQLGIPAARPAPAGGRAMPCGRATRGRPPNENRRPSRRTAGGSKPCDCWPLAGSAGGLAAGVATLGDAGGLACPATQIVELRATHDTAADHGDRVDDRGEAVASRPGPAASSACTSLSTAAATARCRNAFCAVPCNRSPRSPLAASSRAYMCMCMCMCTCTCMCMHICSAHVSAGPTHLPVRLPTLPVGPSLAPPLFVYCPSPAAPPPPRLPSDTPQSGRGAAPPLRPSRWTRCGCIRWRRSCSGCERRTGALVDPHAQTPGRGR